MVKVSNMQYKMLNPGADHCIDFVDRRMMTELRELERRNVGRTIKN
jgi:hypothetical protein